MQEFINRQFFNLTLFTLIFGVMFYDTINTLGFSYIDELCAVYILLLFGYKVFRSKTWAFDKMFLFVICVFLFYLLYSVVIHSNSTGAILTDFVIQIKPYLAFFCVYAIRPTLSDNQKKIIRQLVILCSLYVFTVGITIFVYYDIIDFTFTHVSRLATASSVLALLYLYCSDYTKTDKLIFILILSLGLLSTRSKHFGFFAFCTSVVFYFNEPNKMKFSFRNALFILVALALTIVVAWEKIHFYFITGGFGNERSVSDLYARIALYYFGIQILMDYIPLGCGFASYGTYASAVSYSPIYYKYGMNNLYGLTKDNPDFLTDTYYPVLAQFGWVGVVLFFSFWINLAIRAVKSYSKGFGKESVMALMIIVFFTIESTSDATLTHNRGLFMMMMLGLIFSDIKEKETNENTVSK